MEILVTNNPLVRTQYLSTQTVDFIEADLIETLTHIRDLIHKGHHLLTHPLSGSIKPNESPYKSVLITEKQKDIDPKSVTIIEECIMTARKFPEKIIQEKYLEDLQVVDQSLIHSVLK